MSPDALRKRILEEFNCIGLLRFLDVETSTFRELPRFFESSHLSMQLVLENVSALAAASTIVAKLKRELEQQGVELEYAIRVQWKVVSVDCADLECSESLPPTMSEDIEALLESGAALRSISIHITPAARMRISQYAAQHPAAHRPGAIRSLLQAWITRQLSTDAQEYWDPVLYPTRNIEEESIAPLCAIQMGLAEPEFSSKA